ncbi:uncharacterized protein B0H64DRAFT_395308 [Chaetomium fimeti]|uniref:Uncharacterized protein n=1 Tax=Chaetomium fimeti TaxID=1854472 RepID=A0AAE0HFM5_9PEZI|nr:hypothetical protein B0H64DRAFT_395308 [Chaetomium fimeti]
MAEVYDDPNMGGHSQEEEDANLMLPSALVQQYLDQGEHADNGDPDDGDNDNKVVDGYLKNEYPGSEDIHNQASSDKDVDFNEIDFGFDAGDTIFPSSPDSDPGEGLKEDDDLFGDLAKTYLASQQEPGPAAPGTMSALTLPQTDPVVAASHPPQAPEPAVPEPAFNLAAIDPAITGEVPSTAQAPTPAGVPDPQPHHGLPEIPTTPNTRDFVPPQNEISGPALAASTTNLYYPDDLEDFVPGMGNRNQGQYPLGPLQAQGNGTSQAPIGQGGYSNQYQYRKQPYGNSAYPMPPAQPSGGQYGMYPNMQTQRQFTPSRVVPYGQRTGPQNPGYGAQMPQHMPGPMNMTGQGYPMPSTQGSGRLPAYGPQGPGPNQAAYARPNLPGTQAHPHPLNRGRMSHRRSRRASPSNDPSQFYGRPANLRAWGPLVTGHREPENLFRYYQHFAELRPSLTFNREQLITFFLGNGHPNPRRSLTLWVQNVAAQSNARYPNGGASTKCRYKNCPASQKTIMKGFFRVAFDEYSDLTGNTLDPMHNAGYMHLHCFESLFDLGYLIHHGAARLGFRVLPDKRIFNHESRNCASIIRDHGEMSRTYDEWVEGQRLRAGHIEDMNARSEVGQQYSGLKPSPQMILPHSQRLGCKLVEKHLALQVRGRAATRDNRGGPHLGVHRGDLDLLMQLKRQRNNGGALVPQPAATQAPAGQGKKRAHDDSDDEDDYDSDSDCYEVNGPPSDSRRPRQRRRYDNSTLESSNSSDPNQVYGEPATKGGRKRGIDDVEDSSTLPNNHNKRAKQSYETPAYPTPDSQSAGYDLWLDPQSAFEDSINVAFGDEDLYGVSENDDKDDDNNDNDGTYKPPRQHQHQHQPNQAYPTPPHTTTTNNNNNNNTFTLADGAHTRSQTRDAGSIVDELAAQTHLTRSSAHAIQSRLGQQPAHVRARVLAAVPREYAALVLPPGGEVYNDRLAERIGGLDSGQRRGVEDAVARQEMRGKVTVGGRRKLQSM